MKRIRTARELYCELLKSFYFGVYKKGDRLMTYQETHETYGLAKNTIGKAYDMLRSDGFIYTDGTNGTIVTFDTNNPTHVAKVPLEWPSVKPEDTIPYEVAMRLHAHSLYTGLTHSSESQLETCRSIVQDILQRVRCGDSYHEQVLTFWICTISSLSNEFLNCITDHFISRYLYLLPPTHLSPEQQRLIRDSALKYYEFLLDAMERHDFSDFTVRFEKHYHNYYKYGGVVFSKLEGEAIFKEQALYGKLLEDICIKIMYGELQKGDLLPTTKHLCTEYGISTTTVNRAYGILTDMGLVSRRVRSGTKLIVELNSPDLWDTLETAVGLHQHDWRDAMEVLIIISTLSRRINISSDVVKQMKAELERQHDLSVCYGTPYLVSSVLLSPLIASLSIGILHKYYAYLMDIVNRGMTLYTFRIREHEEHRLEIYQLMRDALEALESGDRTLFAALSERAIVRNAELLNEDYTRSKKISGGNLS